MNKKGAVKHLFEREYNIDNMRDEIIHKSNRKYVKVFKYSLVPICLVLILSGYIYLNSRPDTCYHFNGDGNNNTSTSTYSSKKLNVNILNNINYVTTTSSISGIDNYINIPFFEELVGIKVPNDFDNKDTYKAIFDVNDQGESICRNYVFSYLNTHNKRRIDIGISKEYEPIKKYVISDNENKTTLINGVNLVIYKYQDEYLTSFKYKDTYFNIETKDIDEEEFYNLLVSIMK